MIHKSMCINGRGRTSTKLEPEFWDYLKEVADSCNIRLSRLVNEVAVATPKHTNLASALRVYCLEHARRHAAQMQQTKDAPDDRRTTFDRFGTAEDRPDPGPA